jgi:hypothetical protein
MVFVLGFIDVVCALQSSLLATSAFQTLNPLQNTYRNCDAQDARLTRCRAVADAKSHIKSFIKHQVRAFRALYRSSALFATLKPVPPSHQEQNNDAKASAYAAHWYRQTVTKAKERYEQVRPPLLMLLLRQQPHCAARDLNANALSTPPPSSQPRPLPPPAQDEERTAAAAAAAKLKGAKHLRLSKHPL